MKKTLALLLALCLCFGLMAGCAKEETPDVPDQPDVEQKPDAKPDEKPEVKPEVKPEEPKKPAEPFVYYWTRSGEETVLNPHDANLGANYEVVDRTTGMLYFYLPSEDGTKAVLSPNLADGEPTVAADGVTWTIKVHPDAKWANGEKIDAHTFEYSLKMSIDPKLFWKTGQQVCSNYITIKNALAYYKQVADGTTVKWEDVGIKAIDDQTLQIVTDGHYTKTEVMRQLYLRSAGPVYEPIYSKCISADGTTCDYGSSLDKYVCSGQYVIESWKKASEIVMLRNENWIHKDLIHMDKVISRVVTDESTRLELFEKGMSDSVGLGTNGMAKYGEDPRVLNYPSKTINTLEVNQNPTEKMYLKDPNFRKALFYSIDREAIAKLTNNFAAPYFLSTVGQMLDDGTLYRDMPEAKAIVPKNGGYDPELAKKYMDQVFQDHKLDKIELKLLYTEGNESRRAASEFIQSAMNDLYGGKVKIELAATPSNVLLKTMRTSQNGPVDTWDLAWSGWGLAAESYYPWKKFEKYTSDNGSRYTNYTNEKVNELYLECLKEENRLNDKKLAALTVEMEQAMYDDMTCVPVYQNNSFTMYSERIDLPMKVYNAGVGFGWMYSKLK